MKQNVHEEAKPPQASSQEPRPTVNQVIINAGVPVFSGWGPRIAGATDLLRSMN